PSPLGQSGMNFVEPTVQDQSAIGDQVVMKEEVAVETEMDASIKDPDGPAVADVVNPVIDAPEELLHIDCPNGHELEVPRVMLDQDALCPKCDVRFRLRETDSVEYQLKKKVEMETHERRVENAWLNWTIALGIIVMLFFVTLWAMSLMSKKTVARDQMSRRISCAAFLPQAPMTPPPGWLAAPHR
ncbi:MAG: hypothetical protein VB912_15750, partial [Pirellulaceae bacterium]